MLHPRRLALSGEPGRIHRAAGDTDGVYGPVSERTRAAKHRLAAAMEEFSAYQDDLRRRAAPLLRRVK